MPAIVKMREERSSSEWKLWEWRAEDSLEVVTKFENGDLIRVTIGNDNRNT